jgi:hypothetical protein
MPQFAFTGRQTLADFSQRSGRCELTKHHGHELAPTGKTAGVPFGVVLLDGLLKLASWEQLEQLGKNAAYSIHGGSLRSVDLVRAEPKSTVSELPPEFAKS